MPLKYYSTAASEIESGESYDREIEQIQAALRDGAVALEQVQEAILDEFEEDGNDPTQNAIHNAVAGINAEYQKTMDCTVYQQCVRDANKVTTKYLLDHSCDTELEPGTLGDLENITRPLEQVFREQLDASWAQISQLPDPDKFAHGKANAQFLRFWNAITQVREPGKHLSLEDIKDYYGEDLLVAVSNESTKCPLTGLTLENPVRASCGHAFSRASITTHIQNLPEHRGQCPVPACSNVITLNQLKQDPALEQRVARLESRRERFAARHRMTMDTA